MVAYLVAEEGPSAGLNVPLAEGEEWILGRDPDLSFLPIEDPAVSRRHVKITFDAGEYWIENLSSVNPAMLNGKVIDEVTQLHEQDVIQIGDSLLRFTKKVPAHEKKEANMKEPTLFQPGHGLDTLSLTSTLPSRYLIKITSGPNKGAEFPLQDGASYLIGKDPLLSDIAISDSSVSKQHARLFVSEEGVITIEDMSSKNGLFVNGTKVRTQKPIYHHDTITLGTTSFLLIDQKTELATIYAPPVSLPEEMAPEEGTKPIKPKSWKEMIIPTRHLILAGTLLILLIFGIGGLLSLFHSHNVITHPIDEKGEIEKILNNFPSVEYTFENKTGTIFLIGHVLTSVSHQELLYLLRALPFITQIEDTLVTDEIVYSDMNALIGKNPTWNSVTMIAMVPGKFILRGYVNTTDDMKELMDFINRNFSFLDRLDNQVVVEQILNTQIAAMLTEKGLLGVTFQLSGGEVVLSGKVGENSKSALEETIAALKKLAGVATVKNFTVTTTASTERIDLSSRFTVTGVSKYGAINQFVILNGKIFATGDLIEGMTITDISPTAVLLEKDGLKYQIQYNLQ